MAAAAVGDRVPETLGVVIFMLLFGGIFVLARTITRTILKPNFGWDDALIIITWFLDLGYAIAVFVAVGHGYGKPMATLSEEQLVATMRAFSVAEVLAVWTFPTGKASIAYLLQRIFPGRTLRWILWSFVVINGIMFYLNGVLFLTQCRPVQYIWDRSVEGGTCWNPHILRDYGWATGIFGGVTDFVFATLPWYYLRGLRIGLREKICVGIALSMGLIATACCIVKNYLTVSFWTETDVTYGTVPLVVWSSAELGLINVAACIPTLRPMYLWLTGRDPREGSSKKSSAARPLNSATSDGSAGSLGSAERKSQSLDSNIYHVRSFRVSYEDGSQNESNEKVSTADA